MSALKIYTLRMLWLHAMRVLFHDVAEEEQNTAYIIVEPIYVFGTYLFWKSFHPNNSLVNKE